MFRLFKKKKEIAGPDTIEALMALAKKLDEFTSSIMSTAATSHLEIKSMINKFESSMAITAKEISGLKKSITIKEGLDKSFVYSFYLINTNPLSISANKDYLIQLVADNDSEAQAKCEIYLKSQGCLIPDWKCMTQTRLDIAFPKEEKGVVFKSEYPTEEKAKNLFSYVNDLLYIKDNFARSSHEKGIITKIINSIKEQYGNSK